MTVEELLVVTFTEAATEELRGRIRSNGHMSCAHRLSAESTDNPLYARLLEEVLATKAGRTVVYYWRNDKWTGAVFTIHGFCRRMLSLNAFRIGMLFEQQLVKTNLCCVIRPAPISGGVIAYPAAARHRAGGV